MRLDVALMLRNIQILFQLKQNSKEAAETQIIKIS